MDTLENQNDCFTTADGPVDCASKCYDDVSCQFASFINHGTTRSPTGECFLYARCFATGAVDTTDWAVDAGEAMIYHFTVGDAQTTPAPTPWVDGDLWQDP